MERSKHCIGHELSNLAIKPATFLRRGTNCSSKLPRHQSNTLYVRFITRHREKAPLVRPPCTSKTFSSKESTFSYDPHQNWRWIFRQTEMHADKKKKKKDIAASAFISHRNKAAWSLGLTGWLGEKKIISDHTLLPPLDGTFLSPQARAFLFSTSCTRPQNLPSVLSFSCNDYTLKEIKETYNNIVHSFNRLRFNPFSLHTPAFIWTGYV